MGSKYLLSIFVIIAFMKNILSKLFYLFFMLMLISAISFLAIKLAPSSFFASGELNPNITVEAIEQQRAVYGLNKPLSAQYVAWLEAFTRFDFGISFTSGRKVSEEIAERLPITLMLNLVSMAFIFLFSLYMGIKAALSYGGGFDGFAKKFSLLSFALPSFYLAILLVQLLSLQLGLFPISGVESVEKKEGFSHILDVAWHLSLPIFVMVFGGIGSLAMYIRSLTLEILKSDYVFYAKSRGIGGFKLLRRYILPNLYPPIITMLGLSLPGILGGSVILESLFGIEGMGLLFYQSALSRDYPVIMGILIIGAFLTLLGNMLADLALLKINPFFKKGRG